MHDCALARFRCVRLWAEYRAAEILSPSCFPQRRQAPTPASWSHTTGTVLWGKVGVMGVGGRHSGRASGQEGSLGCLGKNKYESLYSKGSKKERAGKRPLGPELLSNFLILGGIYMDQNTFFLRHGVPAFSLLSLYQHRSI